MTKITTIFREKFLLLLMLLATGLTWGQSVWTNPIDGSQPSSSNPFTSGDVKDANITVSGIGMAGLTANAGGNAYNATGWPSAGTISTGSYFSFTLTPNAGYAINFESFVFSRQRSGTGPLTWAVRSSLDNFAANIGETFSPGTSNGSTTINISSTAYQNITAPVTFRVYGWGATGATGTGRISDFTFNGTVVAVTHDPPVATAATLISTAGFTANWNTVTGATGYRLDVSTDAGFTSIVEDYDNIAVNGTSLPVTMGIVPNTTYYYRVRAEFGEETSEDSNVITVATPQPALLPPVAIDAIEISATGFTANWIAAATATGYYLDVSTLPGFGTTLPGATITETFNNMPPSGPTVATHTWTGDGGITWTATNNRTDRVINGTTDRIACIFRETPSDEAYLESGSIATPLSTISFDAWKPLNNGSYSTLTVYVLWGADFATRTTIGSVDTPTSIGFNTFNSGPITGITGNYKIRIEVTANYDRPMGGLARSGINNLRFGGDAFTPSFVPGYENLDVSNVTSYPVTGLQNNTTYYYRLRSYNGTITSLNSNVITAVTNCETITPPTAAAQQLCVGATVAILTAAEANVIWYSAQTGGTALLPATALATGTYYAALATGNCESVRVAVPVTVNTVAVPGSQEFTICNSGIIFDLIVNGTDLKWYDSAEGGTLLNPDSPLATGTYYVTQTMNGCESLRSAVLVTVNQAPNAPVAVAQSFCVEATVANLLPVQQTIITSITDNFDNAIAGGLTGTHSFQSGPWAVQNLSTSNAEGTAVSGSAMSLYRYSAATSPAFNRITSVTFYAKATADKYLEVKKIVNGVETLLETIALTTTMQQYTIAVNETNNDVKIRFVAEISHVYAYIDNMVFNFTEDSPETINWYTTATDGTALSTAHALSTGNYYVSATLNGCESIRTPVAVAVHNTPVPAFTEMDFCRQATVADFALAGEGLKLYNAATGGEMLEAGVTLTNGNYYASQTLNGCESPRTPIAVSINITEAPVAAPLTFCQPGTVAELTAAGENLKWYNAVTAGEALEDTVILEAGNYYVSQTLNDCESLRTEVAVIMNVTDMPIGAALQDYTNGETLADLDPAGNNIVWYAEADLVTILPETTLLVNAATYYAVQFANSCGSLPLAVTVNEVMRNGSFNANALKLYPNPVKDVLNISYSEPVTSVAIYNAIGQKVIEQVANNTEMQVNMSTLSDGVYVVHVVSGSQSISVRIMK